MKSAEALSVFVYGERCGTLREDAHGALSFEYIPGYSGIPLSLSMPVSLVRYGDRVVRPYLMGLLPDEESTRATIGAAIGVSGDNPFRLLRAFGLDCPGAVQICPAGMTSPAPNSRDDLVLRSDEDIALKLSAAREDAAAAWLGEAHAREHWSLGGRQAKIALRYQGGKWYECLGAAATTHILKPGVVGMENQALVEYLSMKIARKTGLPVAEVEYLMFGEEPAIVVKRYDRKVLEDGSVIRLHQEDLCQSLSVSPSAKYAEQGGPTAPRIIALLKGTGKNARENVYRFILYLFFNYLIGATDAHAKNHSLIIAGEDDLRLAPLYDVATIAPYRSLAPRQRKPLRAALSIGGENRFGAVGASDVDSMVATCGLEELGLDAAFLKNRFASMAKIVPDSVAEVVSEARNADLPGTDSVGLTMQQEIAANCRRTLERL